MEYLLSFCSCYPILSSTKQHVLLANSVITLIALKSINYYSCNCRSGYESASIKGTSHSSRVSITTTTTSLCIRAIIHSSISLTIYCNNSIVIANRRRATRRGNTDRIAINARTTLVWPISRKGGAFAGTNADA